MENFSKLKEIAPYQEASIKEDFDFYTVSETVASIKYKCGLKVLILRIPNIFVINYEYKDKKWSATCGTIDNAIGNVENNYNMLKETHIIV